MSKTSKSKREGEGAGGSNSNSNSDSKSTANLLNTLVTATHSFIKTSDGKDKLLATLQYTAMLIAGPAPATSSLKRTQASITSARKVFRILKPLEMLMPIYQNPSLDWRKPLHVEVLKKLKCLCMALYFGMDHVVWMKQAGLIVKDIQSYQKASMLGWLGGSCCTIWVELEELQLNLKKRYGETDEAYKERQAKEEKEMRKKALVLVHAVCQALLALGLLSLLRKDARKRWSPRTVGVFGVLASAVNCWMMYSEGGKEAIIEVLGLGNSRESRKKEL